jgi:hypothetical protein
MAVGKFKYRWCDFYSGQKIENVVGHSSDGQD